MSARSARRLLDRLARHGVTLVTIGDDGLQPLGDISDELCDAIKREFADVYALIAAREDAEASALIDRAASRFGWGRDDCETALATVERDARRGLHWLRRFAEGLGPPGLVPDHKPAPRTGRVRSKQETTR